MKTTIIRRIASLAVIAGLLFSVSCSKKDHDTPSGTSHKLVFKAKASAGCNISNASYGTEENIINKSSLSGTAWQSEEITTPADAQAASIAVGADGVDASSTLTVQIYVDGELKKEGKSTGEILSPGYLYL